MKKAFTLLLFMFLWKFSYSQGKTYAFFMIGNYAYPNWEKIEFNFTGDGRHITYSYRKNERGHKLEVIGNKYVGNQKALMVRIRSFNKIYLIFRDRRKESLLMVSEDGTYKKRFPLGYEGPVDGRGTYCDICANEPDEAFEIVNSFF
ncbi:hypothetical protein [Spirosoma linguale]|uniref:Uncharacterized protein n=1 Tax=Spirosoma linguale (strain ATCC 33905 / DSM 74 / LMG 10896 / Claus 1) TaxID=504472 RepID=D2QIS6_SPILD|nr:hypothetical protein Slin_4012 [Spirosoma linguale DSM 74]